MRETKNGPKVTNLKADSGPKGSQFMDIHVSFPDLHGGPLTGCSVGPEPSLKRLHSAESLWSLNWLSGKVSSGPAGGCIYMATDTYGPPIHMATDTSAAPKNAQNLDFPPVL